MPYVDMELGQHWLRWWLVWQNQAIIWTNLDSSCLGFCRVHLRAISQEVHTNLIGIMNKKNCTFKNTATFPRGMSLFKTILLNVTDGNNHHIDVRSKELLPLSCCNWSVNISCYCSALWITLCLPISSWLNARSLNIHWSSVNYSKQS